jgi:hypothetical protein
MCGGDVHARRFRVQRRTAIHKSKRERHMGKGNNSQKNDKKNMKVKKEGKKQEIKSGSKKA